jgi:hypothetical protein
MPQPKTRPVYTRLSEQDVRAAKRLAKQQDRTLSGWIAVLIHDEIDEQKFIAKQQKEST